jgi:hypothetical protein
MGDRCAFLTGRLVARPDQTDHLYAYDPFMKELILSTYHLSPRTARDYARVMQEYKVKALAGYPSAVHLLAQVSRNEGTRLSLSAVLTSSETLTDSMRKTISEASVSGIRLRQQAERVYYIRAMPQLPRRAGVASWNWYVGTSPAAAKSKCPSLESRHASDRYDL